MGRIILGIVAAVIVIMLLLAVVHAVIFIAFWAVLAVVVAFCLFRVGKWTGRRSGQRLP